MYLCKAALKNNERGHLILLMQTSINKYSLETLDNSLQNVVVVVDIEVRLPRRHPLVVLTASAHGPDDPIPSFLLPSTWLVRRLTWCL